MISRPFIGVLTAALLSGCVTIPREDGASVAPKGAKVYGFPPNIRTVGLTPETLAEAQDDLNRAKAAVKDGHLDILALSGGGAGGAYGAGMLAGMTISGNRPEFEVVTGVSTGALIAPFAFLGSDWDLQLQSAFTSEAASKLLKDRGLGILFSVSVFKRKPLFDLVNSFVTPEMISAVADASEHGRRLIVGTTDLDIQQPVYWDLGRIAERRDETSRQLFRDVLIASASIPGVFEPMMIQVEAGQKTYEEMHVDGSATVPFFLGPEVWALTSGDLLSARNANLYILVNGRLQAPASATPLNTVQVVARSFDTMMIYAARTAIGEYAAMADADDMNLYVGFIPTDLAYEGPLDFDLTERRTLFNYAQACAKRDMAWFDSKLLPKALEDARVLAEDLKVNFGIPSHCPVQRVEREQEAQASDQ